MTLEAGRRRFGSADGAIALTGVGAPLDRVEGRFKVTGSATYTAEHQITGLTHAALVESTIARGRMARLDVSAAEAAPGVIGVISHLNTPPTPRMRGLLTTGEGFALQTVMPLEDDMIHHAGQPIAVVVADTLDHAQAAARRLRVSYKTEQAVLDFKQAKTATHKPEKAKNELADTSRGDLQAGSANAAMKIDAVYTTPMQHHNPIEPHATIATWEGDHLILYDATQYVSGVRRTVAKTLGIAPEKVVTTVAKHGNTSAASIPLALSVAVADGRIKRGDLVMLEAMGGGFTWGAVLLRW